MNAPENRIEIVCEGAHTQFVCRGRWEYISRVGVTGIVGVVAVTDEGKLLLVEQYRPPVDANVIELPAGLAGDNGAGDEDLADAARRELEEETGYRASDMTPLAEGAPSAGITDEIITLYRAAGLTRTGTGGGDEHETITVHEVPIADVPAWLAGRQSDGAVIDLKVWAGLYFAAPPPGPAPEN